VSKIQSGSGSDSSLLFYFVLEGEYLFQVFVDKYKNVIIVFIWFKNVYYSGVGIVIIS